MGLATNLRDRLFGLTEAPSMLHSVSMPGRAGTVGPETGGNYATFASAYRSNEIVFAAVKLLTDSAAEPHVTGSRMRRERTRRTRAGNLATETLPDEVARMQMEGALEQWRALGLRNRAGAMRLRSALIQNRFIEPLPRHPLVRLLNNPNPFKSRGQMWRTIVMDRLLAGNAYLYKARIRGIGNVTELWRLRPDRMRVKTDEKGIRIGYEYTIGTGNVQTFPVEDVIHFRDPDPLDEHYGMPPLMSIQGRLDIDAYFRGFLKTFFERGGTGPGSILSIKDAKLPDADKKAIKEQFSHQFGAYRGWHEMLIIDNADTSYQQMGLARGLRDALPKELNEVNESRIAMGFRIPGSILGLLIGYESSSYANKRADWQVLWDLTMSPLMSDLDDQLNLDLTPEFRGIDSVEFDLSEIRALQEDEDAMQDRARSNFVTGGWSLEEFRMATGVSPDATEGIFYLPAGSNPTHADKIGEVPPDWAAPDVPLPAPDDPVVEGQRALAAPRRGRRRLADDEDARALWTGAKKIRRDNPSMTFEQLAARVNVSSRTLRRYRAQFG